MADTNNQDPAARLAELETVMAAIPPCAEHGHGCVLHAVQWVEDAKKIVEREELMRKAAADADPSNLQEFLEGQIRIIEDENVHIRNAGAQMLIKVAEMVNAVMSIGEVETVYIKIAAGLSMLTQEARASVADFGKALGIPVPDVKD